MAFCQDKYDAILKSIKKDCFGADLTISFLFAASSSYRHDTVLRPFPPHCTTGNGQEKNYEKLDTILNRVPSLREIHSKQDDPEMIDILHWSLKHGKFALRSCSNEKFALIADLTGHSGKVPIPTHIFEVKYCASLEDRFAERRCGRDLLYAYHGSRVENFHCILHLGLQGHMNKNALFGEGTYLSSELTVSMPYAPAGSCWKESLLGEKMSCVAVCEIIDDPSSVKCQEKETAKGGNGVPRASFPNRSRIADSVGGDVPEKYYVVRNNDVLRVKYLLVYAERRKQKDIRRSWIFQHRFILMIALYSVILIVVGLCNSRLGQKMGNYFKR